MMRWISLVLAVFFSTSTWAVSNTVLEENLYFHYKENIAQGLHQKAAFTRFEQSIYVDALWDLLEEGENDALLALESASTYHFELIERLRLGILRLKYQRALKLPSELAQELANVLRMPAADTKIIYTLAAYEEELLEAGHEDLIALAKNHPQYHHISKDEEKKNRLSENIVADLFYHNPDLVSYMNGEYAESVKIYMFCRVNRLYPCLMVMRDVDGNVVRNADGTLWTNPALASSARGLPSYVRNGNTPAGIHTIDSVMPYADQQRSFGKFRRMILDFVPKSKNEVLHKALLPESSHGEEWWRPNVVARDIGRSLFRIHGTGRINYDPTTPYYPFMRTSGCIAQRENTYDGVTYKDQRDLLDDIMVAMNMEPRYENETKIKGVLFLMELDDVRAPVTAEDLLIRGIE